MIEYGFIDNPKDAIKLQNNITDYAEGVVKAIAEYTNTPYTPPTLSTNYYIVQKGDTLYKIANKYNISVQQLKDLNNLTTDTLQVGQKLLISKQEVKPNDVYIVQKGDTLYKIANKYGITVQELKKINNIITDTLYIGQQLFVPQKDDIGNQPEEKYIIYTIQKGDSLWQISRKFNVTIPEILELNNLTTINLQIGDKLKIPVTDDTPSQKIYIVKSGDTLWSIAKEYNISISELKDANNLETNLLSVGQQLIIP